MADAKIEQALQALKEAGVAAPKLVKHAGVMNVPEHAAALGGKMKGVLCKNLFVKSKSKKNPYYLLVVAGEKETNLKDIASLLGEKQLRFPSNLQELLANFPTRIGFSSVKP